MNVSEVRHVYLVYFIVFQPFKTEAYEVIDWPHVRQSRFQNPINFCYRNLKSWALESGIHSKESEISLTFGIHSWCCRNYYDWFAQFCVVVLGRHCSVSFQSSFGGCTCSQHQETELKPVSNYLTYGWMC